MSGMASVLLGLTVVCVGWAVVASMLMGAWLSRHGVAVNWVLYRGLMPWYVQRYRTLTRARDGHTGPLYAHFIVPINLALLFAVSGLIAVVATRR
jgi:hypothetical protein